MYGVGGERDLSEQEIPRLSGWRGCGPVRVGNQAWGQRQLDVYGAVLDVAYTLRAQLSDLAAGTRMFLVTAVEAAAARWREDDQGIWEMHVDSWRARRSRPTPWRRRACGGYTGEHGSEEVDTVDVDGGGADIGADRVHARMVGRAQRLVIGLGTGGLPELRGRPHLGQ